MRMEGLLQDGLDNRRSLDATTARRPPLRQVSSDGAADSHRMGTWPSPGGVAVAGAHLEGLNHLVQLSPRLAGLS